VELPQIPDQQRVRRLGCDQPGVVLRKKANGRGDDETGAIRAYSLSVSTCQTLILRREPFAADWDGDGRPDLLVGAGDGSVLWYRNVRSTGSPELAAAQVLIPPPQEASLRGALNEIRTRHGQEELAMQPGKQRHGRVWLMLRRNP
jgi:hypothetical protein